MGKVLTVRFSLLFQDLSVRVFCSSSTVGINSCSYSKLCGNGQWPCFTWKKRLLLWTERTAAISPPTKHSKPIIWNWSASKESECWSRDHSSRPHPPCLGREELGSAASSGWECLAESWCSCCSVGERCPGVRVRLYLSPALCASPLLTLLFCKHLTSSASCFSSSDGPDVVLRVRFLL